MTRAWHLILQRAIALHQEGNLAQAQPLYREVLAAVPDHADALHLLGVLSHQLGQTPAAEALIRRALAVQPQAPAYQNSLGNVLRAQFRAAEAEACYRTALRLQPNAPELHHHLGLALKDQGRLQDAEASFRQAIRLRKDFVPARIDLVNLLLEADRAREAEVTVRAALRAAPGNAIALNALGLVLGALGRHEEALLQFDTSLRAAPSYHTARANRAAALAHLERFEEAAAAYEAVLPHMGNAPDLRMGLARTLLQLKRGPALEALARAELARQPGEAEWLKLLGQALALQERLSEACDCFCTAIDHDPKNAGAWHDMGMALRDLGRWSDSVEPFARAAALLPEDPDMRSAYGYALLAIGAFEQAWPHFEYRTKKPGNASLREPQWDGTATERTLLIHAEQGLGDTLQFCRFVPQAARLAPNLIFAGPKSLQTVMASLRGAPPLLVGKPVPPYDLHCPLMSLPGLLRLTSDQFADAVPYLHADPKRIETWRERLAHMPQPRVGLVWNGNPNYPADRRRSVGFENILPLLALAGLSFVSLQMGEAGAPAGAANLFDAAPFLADFADTAAALAALDLVVSVDTAVAHLAGALGRPVWLLNRADTDWRWLLDRNDSPWYPSLRQFRQPTPGDWPSAVAAVATALRCL